jgi:hypothetical protein
MDTDYISKRVENTYEAAYYMTGGAKVTSVETRTLPKNTKKNYKNQWTFYLTNIPLNYVELWQTGKCSINPRQIEPLRNKLKRLVKRTYFS